MFCTTSSLARFNEINDQLGLIQVTTADPRQKQDIDNQWPNIADTISRRFSTSRVLVDSTQRRYAELAQDDTVKTALEALKAKPKSPLKLGPSRGFDESVQTAREQGEIRAQQGRRDETRGGVFEVDVTLNGKETIPMIFDTGASLVTLSSEFAAKIGLTPQARTRPSSCTTPPAGSLRQS